MNDDLPEGWTYVLASDLFRWSSGKFLPKTKQQPGSIPVFGGNGIAGSHNEALVEFPTLVVGRVGALCGNVYRTDGPAWITDNAIYARALPAEIDLEYCELVFSQADLGTRAGGSGQPFVNQDVLNSVEIPLPPEKEQRRIVEQIEALRAKVRSSQQRLDTIPTILKRFRQAVLSAACDGRLTADWRRESGRGQSGRVFLQTVEREKAKWSASTKGRRMGEDEVAASADEELPEIPEEWAWATVDKLATKVVDGVHKKPEYVTSGIPFLTVRNLTAGPGISFEKTSFVRRADHEEFIKRANPERGDILVTKDGTLGVVRFVDTDAVFSIFVSLALIKPAVRTSGRYLALALSSPQIQRRIVVTGTGLQHIHLRDLRAVQIPIPSKAEQDEIVRRVDAFLNLAERLERRYAKARVQVDKLTQSVLAKAFRGELVPTEAELARREERGYETAVQLLERIKNVTPLPGRARVRQRLRGRIA